VTPLVVGSDARHSACVQALLGCCSFGLSWSWPTLSHRDACSSAATRSARGTWHQVASPRATSAILVVETGGIAMNVRLLCVVLGCSQMACTEPPPDAPPPAPYPQAPRVDADALAQVLPKDSEGRPVLLTVDGTPLTLGPPRKDGIGAAAGCSDLKNDCVQATKDPDSCIGAVKRCETQEPWNEVAPCCPDACVVAYQEQRRLGATPIEADSAVFGSTHECFPGLQEIYRAAGGTPYLAPRRAP